MSNGIVSRSEFLSFKLDITEIGPNVLLALNILGLTTTKKFRDIAINYNLNEYGEEGINLTMELNDIDYSIDNLDEALSELKKIGLFINHQPMIEKHWNHQEYRKIISIDVMIILSDFKRWVIEERLKEATKNQLAKLRFTGEGVPGIYEDLFKKYCALKGMDV